MLEKQNLQRRQKMQNSRFVKTNKQGGNFTEIQSPELITYLEKIKT